MSRAFVVLVAVMSVFLAGVTALHGQAAGSPPPNTDTRVSDRFTASLSQLLLSTIDTNVRLDSAAGPGSDIDFEDDLGLADKANRLRGDLVWRVGQRSYVDLNYLVINRSGAETLSRTIDFGGQIFDIGLAVESFFDTRYMGASYRHSFVKTERAEYGGSIGVNMARASTGISAIGQGEGQASETASITAPVPLLGLHGAYGLNPNTYLTAEVQYIDLTFGNITGTESEITLAFDYHPSANLGLGIGYVFDRLKVEASRSSFTGKFTYDFSGLDLHASYKFN